jgi:hypothetical protein
VCQARSLLWLIDGGIGQVRLIVLWLAASSLLDRFYVRLILVRRFYAEIDVYSRSLLLLGVLSTGSMVGLRGRALIDGGRMWWDEQAQARATPPLTCSICFHLFPRLTGAFLYSLGSLLPRNSSHLLPP